MPGCDLSGCRNWSGLESVCQARHVGAYGFVTLFLGCLISVAKKRTHLEQRPRDPKLSIGFSKIADASQIVRLLPSVYFRTVPCLDKYDTYSLDF